MAWSTGLSVWANCQPFGGWLGWEQETRGEREEGSCDSQWATWLSFVRHSRCYGSKGQSSKRQRGHRPWRSVSCGPAAFEILYTLWQFVKACEPRSKPLVKSSRCANYTISRYCAARTLKFNVLPRNTKNNDVRRRMKLLAVVLWALRYLRFRIPNLNCEASWIFMWKSLNRYGLIGSLFVLGNNNIPGWGHFEQ